MTMTFDMSSSNLGNATNSSGNYLQANKIHHVEFDGIEYSKSKDGKYEFMITKFKDANGASFTDRHFGLTSTSNERKQSQYGANPSEYEAFMTKVKHLMFAVSPEAYQGMMDGTIKFTPKTKNNIFKQYVEFLAATLKPAIGNATEIKLVKDRDGKAAFPMFYTGISKDDETKTYLKTNFIGKGLAFTSKELETIKNQTTATPTTMPTTSVEDEGAMSIGETTLDEAISSDEDMNLDL